MKLGLKFINKKCIYWLHTSFEKLLIITMNIKESINTPRPYIRGGLDTPSQTKSCNIRVNFRDMPKVCLTEKLHLGDIQVLERF